MEKGDRLRESPNKDRNDDRLVSALETPLHGMTADGTVTSVPVVLISEVRPKVWKYSTSTDFYMG